MIPKVYIVFHLFLILSAVLNAQDMKVVGDLRARTSLGLVKGITKKLEVFGELELGMEQNISKLGKLHLESGLSYSLLNFLTADAKYRFTENRKNYSQTYKYTHMFAIAMEAKHKHKRLKSYLRIQYQNIDEDIFSFDGMANNHNLIKTRVRFKYNLKGLKMTPFLSTEVYGIVGINNFNATKLKTIGGVGWDFSKHDDLKIYYRNDKELSHYLPFCYHTMGCSYTYKF
ncbi:MAG: DUF2490 domain-containing protein [Prolixibacteraceae bacterium]